MAALPLSPNRPPPRGLRLRSGRSASASTRRVATEGAGGVEAFHDSRHHAGTDPAERAPCAAGSGVERGWRNAVGRRGAVMQPSAKREPLLAPQRIARLRFYKLSGLVSFRLHLLRISRHAGFFYGLMRLVFKRAVCDKIAILSRTKRDSPSMQMKQVASAGDPVSDRFVTEKPHSGKADTGHYQKSANGFASATPPDRIIMRIIP